MRQYTASGRFRADRTAAPLGGLQPTPTACAEGAGHFLRRARTFRAAGATKKMTITRVPVR